MSRPAFPTASAALLVIDMQRGFADPESHMGRTRGVAPQQAIVARIAEAVALCRHCEMPVLWSRQIHLPEDVTRARKRLATHAQKQGFLPCLRGTHETELIAPIAELVDEARDHVIDKHRASVFFDTNLSTRLRMLGIDTLIIAGCNTEFCVAHTVRDAYARDYEIVVLEDAVAGIEPRFHALCLEMFGAYFAEVMPVGELAAWIEEPSA